MPAVAQEIAEPADRALIAHRFGRLGNAACAETGLPRLLPPAQPHPVPPSPNGTGVPLPSRCRRDAEGFPAIAATIPAVETSSRISFEHAPA